MLNAVSYHEEKVTLMGRGLGIRAEDTALVGSWRMVFPLNVSLSEQQPRGAGACSLAPMHNVNSYQ